MEVLLTGATGFIGSRVLAELERRAVNVVAITRRPTALPACSSRVNVVELDLREVSAGSYDAFGRPDLLIHLAWGGLPDYDSTRHYEVELPLHYGFIRTLVDAGLPAVAISGTCLEYGLQCGALREDAAALPTTPYGYAKDALRKQLEFLRGQRGFSLTWMRLFYTYGSGQSPTSLYSQLHAAAKRRDATFQMSSGEQLRDYVAGGELVRLLTELALKRANAGVVNVCSGRPVSVRRLVESWIATEGYEIGLDLSVYPQPKYEPLAFWGDRSKLDAILEA
jgi:nucleoside-diphosphate-sugar epimerase